MLWRDSLNLINTEVIMLSFRNGFLKLRWSRGSHKVQRIQSSSFFLLASISNHWSYCNQCSLQIHEELASSINFMISLIIQIHLLKKLFKGNQEYLDSKK